MSSEIGKKIHISLFGESHGPAIGVVLEGLPAGEPIEMEALSRFLSRRAPGKAAFATARQEADLPVFLSGVTDGKTNGAPLCAVIYNQDAHGSDYAPLRDIPRPSHADYTAMLRYGGFQDVSGGGHFSGRLTAPLCIAGGICLQVLARKNIFVGAHLASVGPVADQAFDPVFVSAAELSALAQKEFPVIDDACGEQMIAAIARAKEEQDSLGGIIEGCAVGFPGGVGTPIFDGIENRMAGALFGIPAVKGVEFGAGFAGSALRGSQYNDAFYWEEEQVKTRTNRHGGILGGISSGMPILFRVAMKPTPSIAQQQQSVSLSRRIAENLTILGRHDPCVAVRAVPCVEAITAIVLLDLFCSEPPSFVNEPKTETRTIGET